MRIKVFTIVMFLAMICHLNLSPIYAAADEQIETKLQSAKVKEQPADPPTTEEATDGGLDGGGTHPSTGTPSTDNPGTSGPGDGDGQGSPGDAGTDGTSGPGTSGSGGTSGPGGGSGTGGGTGGSVSEGGNGSAVSPGTGGHNGGADNPAAGDSDSGAANPGNTGGSGTVDPAAPNQSGEIDPADPNKPEPSEVNKSEDGDGKSWWDNVFSSDWISDTAEKLGRGLAVGVIGAVVVGVIVVAALAIGITISAPVWIAAVAVAIVAGVVYSFVAGDAFSWIEGIGVSVLAGISVLAIATSGIGAAARTAFQFLRGRGLTGLLSGARQALTSSWRGITSLFEQGLWAGLKNGARTLLSQAPRLWKSLIWNANTGFQFGLNMVASFSIHMLTKDTFPGLSDMGMMITESFLGAVVFGKLAEAAQSLRLGRFVTTSWNFLMAGAETFVVNLIKREKTDAGSLLLGSFAKAFVFGPLLGRLFRSNLFIPLRNKLGIGLTRQDLENKFGMTVSDTVGQKGITNKQLLDLLKTKPEDLTRSQQIWLQSGVLSENQAAMLNGNEELFQKFFEKQQMVGEKLLEEGTKPGNYPTSKPAPIKP
ncbi:hypothetical protein MU1_30670 [Paenibacillus glycanilyticus]|uniref:Uncharacterized protein n=2 Tax=Paenibacillus glycanilyticus TaxID=126569 RepID=A0ABQ6GI40_9BACL|nr:hypothetical protein MU1_30670 [Paenibacillus glycanilyticus]